MLCGELMVYLTWNVDIAENQLSVETIQGAVAGDQDAVQKVILKLIESLPEFDL